MKYYQCRMHQVSEVDTTKYVIVAYIEEHGARKGVLVELKGEPGLWEVDTVDDHPIEYSAMKEKQLMDRRSLVSITG